MPRRRRRKKKDNAGSQPSGDSTSSAPSTPTIARPRTPPEAAQGAVAESKDLTLITGRDSVSRTPSPPPSPLSSAAAEDDALLSGAAAEPSPLARPVPAADSLGDEYVMSAPELLRKRQEAVTQITSKTEREWQAQGFFALSQHAAQSRMHEAEAAEAAAEHARRLELRDEGVRQLSQRRYLNKMRGPFAGLKEAVRIKELSKGFAERRLGVIDRTLKSGRTDGCISIENDPVFRTKFEARFNAWLVDSCNLTSVDAALGAAIKRYNAAAYSYEVPYFGVSVGRERNRAAEIRGMMGEELRSSVGTLGIIVKLLKTGDWEAEGHDLVGSSGLSVGHASFNMVLMSTLLEQFAQDLAQRLITGELPNYDGVGFQMASAALSTSFISNSDLTRGLFQRSLLSGARTSGAPAVSKDMIDAKALADSYFKRESGNIAVKLKKWLLDPRNHTKLASLLSRCVGIYETRVLAAGDRTEEIRIKLEDCTAKGSSPVLWLGALMGTGNWKVAGHLAPGPLGSDSFNILAMTEIFRAYSADLAYDLATGVKPGTDHHNLADLQLWLTCANHPSQFKAVARTVFDNMAFVTLKPEDVAQEEKAADTLPDEDAGRTFTHG
ncbi:MAG: hypothetical protein P1U40_09195 [Coxiellaceae bacterium]|nr:hypothetical protein [Coxiellaceae bacterium]